MFCYVLIAMKAIRPATRGHSREGAGGRDGEFSPVRANQRKSRLRRSGGWVPQDSDCEPSQINLLLPDCGRGGAEGGGCTYAGEAKPRPIKVIQGISRLGRHRGWVRGRKGPVMNRAFGPWHEETIFPGPLAQACNETGLLFRGRFRDFLLPVARTGKRVARIRALGRPCDPRVAESARPFGLSTRERAGLKPALLSYST